METWSAHHLYKKVEKELGNDTAFEIQKYANSLRKKGLPVIFSLGHLSNITGIDYKLLHDTVNRRREKANYNLFPISKRSGGRRFIHAVNGKLFDLQKYINEEILQKIQPHPSSYAYHRSGGIRACASQHCGCKWLFQFDLKDFFYTISEPLVFDVFRRMGYTKLLSFELARLCTTLYLPVNKQCYLNYIIGNDYDFLSEEIMTKPYLLQHYIGVLPQGAPTSPMISNLAATKMDENLYTYSQSNGFVYTRYADDLTFSACVLPERKSIGQIKREILSLIRKSGFKENTEKIRVAGPGSKKTVLGLLVDDEQPRISNELLKRIDRNLYSIEKFGIEQTALHDGFESQYGLINHISGLISYIKDVDYERWKKLKPRFRAIQQSFYELE
jgi:RNA-directed DNA polymerase